MSADAVAGAFPLRTRSGRLVAITDDSLRKTLSSKGGKAENSKAITKTISETVNAVSSTSRGAALRKRETWQVSKGFYTEIVDNNDDERVKRPNKNIQPTAGSVIIVETTTKVADVQLLPALTKDLKKANSGQRVGPHVRRTQSGKIMKTASSFGTKRKKQSPKRKKQKSSPVTQEEKDQAKGGQELWTKNDTREGEGNESGDARSHGEGKKFSNYAGEMKGKVEMTEQLTEVEENVEKYLKSEESDKATISDEITVTAMTMKSKNTVTPAGTVDEIDHKDENLEGCLTVQDKVLQKQPEDEFNALNGETPDKNKFKSEPMIKNAKGEVKPQIELPTENSMLKKGKKTIRAGKLKFFHRIKVDGGTHFCCDSCSVTTDLVEMLHHAKTAHGLSEVAACPICYEFYRSDKGMMVHARKLHPKNEIQYKCHICLGENSHKSKTSRKKSAFAKRSLLQKHIGSKHHNIDFPIIIAEAKSNNTTITGTNEVQSRSPARPDYCINPGVKAPAEKPTASNLADTLCLLKTEPSVNLLPPILETRAENNISEVDQEANQQRNSSSQSQRGRPGGKKLSSLADKLGLRYRRVANLVHPNLGAMDTNEDYWAGTVKPYGGALSNRYLKEVSTYKVDSRVLSGPAYAQLQDDPDLAFEALLEDQDSVNTMRQLRARVQRETPSCQCLPPDQVLLEDKNNPSYEQLGSAKNLDDLKSTLIKQLGCLESELRVEKVRFVPKEGKGKYGCPVSKYIIRRSSISEKYLAVVKQRPGHHCESTVIVVALVAWEGVSKQDADTSYNIITDKLSTHGFETFRKCGLNKGKRCACQGTNAQESGASFSFGCSWSYYLSMCKFAKSKREAISKFKLADDNEVPELEETLQRLATLLSPLYQRMAPIAYGNQVAFESVAGDCRIGLQPGRPFSGVTAVVDFCAHAHRDVNNLPGGCTVVLTLTKPENRPFATVVPPPDEQLHVLPHYAPEYSSDPKFGDRVEKGSLQYLNKFHRVMGVRQTPFRKTVSRTVTPRKRSQRTATTTINSKSGKTFGSDVPVHSEPKASLPADATLNNSSVPLLPKSQTQPPTFGGHSIRYAEVAAPSNSNSHSYKSLLKPGYSSEVEKTLSHRPDHSKVNKQFYLMGAKYLSEAVNGPHLPQFDGNQEVEDLEAGVPLLVCRVPGQTPSGQPLRSQWPTSARPATAAACRPSWTNSPPIEQRPQLHIPEVRINQSHQFPNAVWEFSLTENEHQLHPVVEQQLQQSPVLYDASMGQHFIFQPLAMPQNHQRQLYRQTPEVLETPLPPAEASSYAIDDKSRAPNENRDPPPIIHYEESDNDQLFEDESIGGLALALTHGSVLFECARIELHATTALKRPNRCHPTRIGLVFYQHKALNFPNHGKGAQPKLREINDRARRNWEEKVERLNDMDYEAWLTGDFVPTSKRLELMRKAGLPFPEEVAVVPQGSKLILDSPLPPPDLSFLNTHPNGDYWLERMKKRQNYKE